MPITESNAAAVRRPPARSDRNVLRVQVMHGFEDPVAANRIGKHACSCDHGRVQPDTPAWIPSGAPRASGEMR